MTRKHIESIVKPRFEKDTANHVMEVIRDDGVNRHIRFREQEQPSQELASQTASTNPVVSQKAAGTVDKDCGNCKKFSTNSLTGGPVCISCKDYSNWEPKP